MNYSEYSVFGLVVQPYIGEHILRHRPSTVVVETAISPTHGAASGNTFTCSRLAQDSNFFERLFCQVSAQLTQMPDPTSTRLWQVGVALLPPLNANELLSCKEIAYVWGESTPLLGACAVNDVPMLHTMTCSAKTGQGS